MKIKGNTKNTKICTKNTTWCSLWCVGLFVSLLFCTKVFSQQTEKVYLSGTGNDNTKNWEFFCTAGMNSGKWTTIPVPSCWELQGFGKYDYGFAKDSVRGKEKGLYKHRFNVPANWKGKAINIVFEGVMTDAEVKVNGKAAGAVHQGAFYAFKYNVSELLNYGKENLLEVTVVKHSSNQSVNEAERKADFWIFGGIFRPVWLEVLPAVHIEHVAINAKMNGGFIASIITNSRFVDNATFKIISEDGSVVGGDSFDEKGIYGTTKQKFNFATAFFHLNNWSPEKPILYTAIISVFNKGRLLHTLSQKFGFRTVEVKQRDGIYVNGVKVKMKGVNRHAFRPETGRTTSKRISIEDVLLMKGMNMNAVRMSHYPPDDHFLDVCDSLGLFVMDELAGWHGHYDIPTGTKLVKEMLAHDVNHPSIVIWSNGNEGGHNFELDSLFAEYDIQKRPVIHPWQLFGGFETQHYREYNYGIGNYEHGHDILMPTEFLHGMYDGGHGAGLEDYWEAMWKNPLSAGGYLWDFADQGVVRKDRHDSIDTDGNRGADGIIGPYHEKEGSYYAIKEIWSPIYFEPKEITSAFDGKLNIENRYHYTNTNQCSFSWKLKKLTNNKEITGIIVSPNIKPSAKGFLQVNLPLDWKGYDVLYVTAKDFYKRELFTWSFPIVRPEQVAKNIITREGTSKVALVEHDSVYRVSANGVEIAINKNTGVLLQVKNNKSVIPFNNGPILQEGVNNFRNFSHRYEGNSMIIESSLDRRNSYNKLQWTIYPSGWIKMEVNYFPAEYFTSLVGVNFSFPEKNIKAVRYMGDGPYRVWKNRMKGTQFGIWDKTYNNTETGEAPCLYPEFKGYHSNMYWCKFITNEQNFTVVTENEDVFMRLFTPAWKTDQWHNYEPIFPNGDISFMQAIPGIGSKTQRAETTGPMGMKNIFYDYEKDPQRWLTLTLYFNFSEKQ